MTAYAASSPAGAGPPRGKTRAQALLRLARHRISVLFAMLRDGTFCGPRSPRLA
ncbi:hypothetical protein LUW75_23860 [Streptomyces sp. MRC013]|uniref:hypothetical protein n=1 Tax=Streptomyces sp. MRC013 TaxID=2898276 RepID=UPI002025F238|nr:hypothetical protein [Streptomyces sp. MRC013]URM92858.1 hypothetical protein LUW75_23860 [Streptomyces sp. MRC013]